MWVDDVDARVGVLSRATASVCDEDAELTAVLLPAVVCEWFFGRPKSSLRAGLSGPFTMSPKRAGDRDGVRDDADKGLLRVLSENIPSASSILRFAGLKIDGAPGERGLLFPDLNGLFGKLGLEGRNCSNGNS